MHSNNQFFDFFRKDNEKPIKNKNKTEPKKPKLIIRFTNKLCAPIGFVK